MRRMRLLIAALLAGVPVIAQTLPDPPPYQPTSHDKPVPLYSNATPFEAGYHADQGTTIERDRDPRWTLAEHRRLTTALAALQPQRKGVVDAYVVTIGFDSDPVFGREAREAGRVLSRRYDAAGRTVVLAGSDGSTESTLPRGSPDALSAVLARVAELMDPAEDVLILYTTGHGAKLGLVYADGNRGFAMVSPARLWSLLGTLGITNRLLILSACYSGVFVPMLSSPTTAILTAASAERTSFGCQADNDWTYYGDAMINRALRNPVPLAKAVADARGLVAVWEGQDALTPSEPQASIGGEVVRWLGPLERRLPTATRPVGRPAMAAK